MSKISDIQAILGVTSDGSWGPMSQAALDTLIRPVDHKLHRVKASSFADPADVSAFRHCKALGGSDQECFKVGDNGIGRWGDDTTGSIPMCALPPEDWESFGSQARGKEVRVRANGREVVCQLRDTMPRRAHITNGAGIDLNPAACFTLNLHPPVMTDATWQWV